MECYVKDYEWDEIIGKGWVLVGADNGPDLCVDVWNKFPLEPMPVLGSWWSKLYTEAEDEEKAAVQQSHELSGEYIKCALGFIYRTAL